MNNKQKNLIKEASRFLYEAPEDEMGMDDEMGNPNEPEMSMDDSDENTGEDLTKIEVFFSNLDANTQKAIMDSLKNSLNATEDDKFAEKKIVEQLSKDPLFVVMGDELQRQLQIRI